MGGRQGKEKTQGRREEGEGWATERLDRLGEQDSGFSAFSLIWEREREIEEWATEWLDRLSEQDSGLFTEFKRGLEWATERLDRVREQDFNRLSTRSFFGSNGQMSYRADELGRWARLFDCSAQIRICFVHFEELQFCST